MQLTMTLPTCIFATSWRGKFQWIALIPLRSPPLANGCLCLLVESVKKSTRGFRPLSWPDTIGQWGGMVACRLGATGSLAWACLLDQTEIQMMNLETTQTTLMVCFGYLRWKCPDCLLEMRLDQGDLYLANWNKSATNTCQSMALIDSIETFNSNTKYKKLLNY